MRDKFKRVRGVVSRIDRSSWISIAFFLIGNGLLLWGFVWFLRTYVPPPSP